MSAADKTNLKQLLRNECLPALASQWVYFRTENVAGWLARRKAPCPPATLNRYLFDFRHEGLIHAAGRGWYSRLSQSFILNRQSVSSIVEDLTKAFPLVTFSCWSTEQIKAAMHHLLARFVTFVNVETDSMETVWEHLRDSGWDAWSNPRSADAGRFTVRERTLVVRRESRKSPSQDHFAPIEKLLVELCFEARDLNLMSMPDFQAMLANLAGTHRIQMATLLSYAAERKLPLKTLIGDNNQLIPPFQKSRR